MSIILSAELVNTRALGSKELYSALSTAEFSCSAACQVSLEIANAGQERAGGITYKVRDETDKII